MRLLFGKALKKASLPLPIIIVFSLSLTLLPSYVSGSGDASLAMGEAENALTKAFEAVLEAERVGGNISDLIDVLNEAGGLLAEAENTFKTGNFSEAVNGAEKCSVIASNVRSRAEALKGEASTLSQSVFRRNLTVSIVGSAIFLAALFFVWRWFKEAYLNNLLKMKLEVASDAEA